MGWKNEGTGWLLHKEFGLNMGEQKRRAECDNTTGGVGACSQIILVLSCPHAVDHQYMQGLCTFKAFHIKNFCILKIKKLKEMRCVP